MTFMDSGRSAFLRSVRRVGNRESDHPSPEEAAERVAYLNGATDILEFFQA